METTTNLYHKIIVSNVEGVDTIINIRLNDECKNGHQDFAITGEYYPTGVRGDRNCLGSGCIHILKIAPELKVFVDLHLCNHEGVPMYVIGNGFYFLKHGSDRGRPTKDICMEHFRCTSDEFEILATSEDELHLRFLIEHLNLPARWLHQADKAIAKLEGWTGKKFKAEVTRPVGFPFLTEKQKIEIRKKIDSGYYSPEQLKKRESEKRALEYKKKIAELTADRDKELAKINNEYAISLEVLRLGLPDNFIYYDYKNECVFNFIKHEPQVSDSQFKYFLENVDYSKVPGVIFNIREN